MTFDEPVVWPSPHLCCDACGKRVSVSRPGLPEGWILTGIGGSTYAVCGKSRCRDDFYETINRAIEAQREDSDDDEQE